VRLFVRLESFSFKVGVGVSNTFSDKIPVEAWDFVFHGTRSKSEDKADRFTDLMCCPLVESPSVPEREAVAIATRQPVMDGSPSLSFKRKYCEDFLRGFFRLFSPVQKNIHQQQNRITRETIPPVMTSTKEN